MLILKRVRFYKDYENDIIMVRNNLAHCISYQEGNKEILKVKKEGMPDIIFDSEKFKNNKSKYKEVQRIVQYSFKSYINLTFFSYSNKNS